MSSEPFSDAEAELLLARYILKLIEAGLKRDMTLPTVLKALERVRHAITEMMLEVKK